MENSSEKEKPVMTTILLIVFTVSLLYFAIANRLMTYVKILALQGLILFGVTFIELIEINVVNLVLILLETIVVKSIAIPLFMQYVIKKNKITRVFITRPKIHSHLFWVNIKRPPRA